jgi:hypothetical protein
LATADAKPHDHAAVYAAHVLRCRRRVHPSGCRCCSLSGAPPARIVSPLARSRGSRGVTTVTVARCHHLSPRDAPLRPCTLPPVAAPLQPTGGRGCGTACHTVTFCDGANGDCSAGLADNFPPRFSQRGCNLRPLPTHICVWNNYYANIRSCKMGASSSTLSEFYVSSGGALLSRHAASFRGNPQFDSVSRASMQLVCGLSFWVVATPASRC